MTVAIDLREVVVLLSHFPALTGATLRVSQGEIVLLQGPNGAGKSTLLRLCAGLLPIKEGTAKILGQDLGENRRRVRPDIGLLGHKTGLYEDLTVEENIAFWASMTRANSQEITDAIEVMGLGGRLRDVLARQLSAGQRRRTAFAALLVQRPPIWLLDEPHAALDSEGRSLVNELIKNAAAAGATVLLVSHAAKELSALTGRVVTLAGGRVTSDSGGNGSEVNGVS
ncbi:MAG: heme ABC exporter ATP-binding protein CcmA [Acidimicrobiales bacterium]|nr:heme ABC exporter ATP-binding protein CcmA [Acidimicrobiales bacterium]